MSFLKHLFGGRRKEDFMKTINSTPPTDFTEAKSSEKIQENILNSTLPKIHTVGELTINAKVEITEKQPEGSNSEILPPEDHSHDQHGTHQNPSSIIHALENTSHKIDPGIFPTIAGPISQSTARSTISEINKKRKKEGLDLENDVQLNEETPIFLSSALRNTASNIPITRKEGTAIFTKLQDSNERKAGTAVYSRNTGSTVFNRKVGSLSSVKLQKVPKQTEKPKDLTQESLNKKIEEAALVRGISFNFLKSLPISDSSSLDEVFEYIKNITKNDEGLDRSFATYLAKNEDTQTNVSTNARYFISYPRNCTWGTITQALTSFFNEKKVNDPYFSQDDPFVALDFVNLDLHVKSQLNFEVFCSVFQISLEKIPRAIFILSPPFKPSAINSLLSGFEWISAIEAGAVFNCCCAPSEYAELSSKLKNGIEYSEVDDLFRGIDLENNAQAENEEQSKILLNFLKQNTIERSNDILLLVIKDWLLDVANHLISQVTDATEEKAALFYFMAIIHDLIGDVENAFLLYEKSINNSRLVENNDKKLLEKLTSLADLLKSQGKTIELKPVLKEMIQIFKSMKDKQRLNLVLLDLGNFLEEEEKFNEAIPFFEECLENLKQSVGSLLNNKEDLIPCLSSLSNSYFQLTKYEKAEKYQREALEINIEVWGCNHPTVASDLHNLASIIRFTDKLDEATSLYLQSIQIWKEYNKSDNKYSSLISTASNNLAMLYSQQMKLDLAEVLFREALKIDRGIHRGNHEDIAADLSSLSQLLSAKEEFEEAEKLQREAVKIIDCLVGKEDPRYAAELNNLAQILTITKKYEEAEKDFREALKIDTRFFGREHEDVGNDLNNLALVLRLKGDLEAAIAMHLESMFIFISEFGEEDFRVAQATNRLALCYRDQQSLEEAQTLKAKAIRILEKTIGKTNPITLRELKLWET